MNGSIDKKHGNIRYNKIHINNKILSTDINLVCAHNGFQSVHKSHEVIRI
jgi:hypothetical protein